nr:mucin-like protein [Ipomoea batatas]
MADPKTQLKRHREETHEEEENSKRCKSSLNRIISILEADEEADSKLTQDLHLLEASDDELGIPSGGMDGGDNSDEKEMDGGDLTFSLCDDGLWEFEDEAADYYSSLQSELFIKPLINPASSPTVLRRFSSKTGEEEWNDAWETAWLPEDLSGKNRAPWETDVNFSLPDDTSSNVSNNNSNQNLLPPDADTETRAFVEDMNDNWDQRKGKTPKQDSSTDSAAKRSENESSLYSLENVRRDYRIQKQRVHANLWAKEIEKMEEAKLGDGNNADDIEKLLDSASEIFDSANDELNNLHISSSEIKNKPDGWETTSKTLEGNIWEMSQREEDLLLQEFERRIAFNKFQIASFIKTHIFSRRRPIDGWKYMIEEIGPNARKGKGKGSVSRLPTIADASTQPFREETTTQNAEPSPLYQRTRR